MTFLVFEHQDTTGCLFWQEEEHMQEKACQPHTALDINQFFFHEKKKRGMPCVQLKLCWSPQTLQKKEKKTPNKTACLCELSLI